jgi:drug/metabolite transporter (DMT)-like permease
VGLVYAVFAAIAFAVLGISYKIADRWECNKPQVNFFFLAFAAMFVSIWALIAGKAAWRVEPLILGAVMGAITFSTVAVFREAVARGRISTSWTIINLGLVMPVLASILIWREIPSPRHYVGLLLTIGAIILLGLDVGRAGE